MCLSVLSVEDIEDVYLFGTMITGLLLIGLCFGLIYPLIQKTKAEVSVVKLKRYGDMVVILEKLSALQGTWIVMETEIDNRVAKSIGMLLLARTRTFLICISPLLRISLSLGRCWNNSSRRSLQ